MYFCIDCNCDPNGSISKQCDDAGKCQCKSNFKGEKCDECNEGYDGRKCDRCDIKFQYNRVAYATEKCLGDITISWSIFVFYAYCNFAYFSL